MNRNTERRRVDALVQRAHIAGFSLPDSVMSAIRAEQGLQAALIQTREGFGREPTSSDFVRELRAEGGVPADFGKRLAAAQQKAALMKEQERLLMWAIEEQAEDVVTTAQHAADDIIREQVQPALAQLVEEIRPHADAYPDIPWDNFDLAMKLEKPEAREAYKAVSEAAIRYDAIRDAHRHLWDERPATLKDEIRNLRKVWPNYQYQATSNRPPWPSNKTARLAWLVTNGADLWAPTRHEADEEEERQVAAARAGSRLPANAAIEVSRGRVAVSK
jgi:hypothetical protein